MQMQRERVVIEILFCHSGVSPSPLSASLYSWGGGPLRSPHPRVVIFILHFQKIDDKIYDLLMLTPLEKFFTRSPI